MQLEGTGAAHWTVYDAEDALLERAVILFREGASIRCAADELGISRSKAQRFKDKAKELQLLAIAAVPVSH
jgi:hypothetical protein